MRRLAQLLVLCLAALPAAPAQAQGLFDSRAIQELGIDVAAAALANALQASRDAARAEGTRPIPPHIRAALLPWFPGELLDSIAYRVDSGGAGSVQALSIRYGDAIAVAVIDTIIFVDPRDAETNLTLWAHEVQHVAQFRAWGVYGFAQAYIRDHQAVEREAWAAAAAVRAALGGG